MGFRYMSDTCTHKNNINSNDMYIIAIIYVDDIIIAYEDKSIFVRIKQQISEIYKTKDMGVIDCYLEKYIRYPKAGIIKLDQSD